MNRILWIATVALGLMVPLGAQVTPTGGIIAAGTVGSGPRPEGQLLVSNAQTGGHSIVTLLQTIPGEESAIESVGQLSNGLPQQQGAQFWRWLDSDNSATGFESTWSMHLTKYGTDNTPLILLARNSAILCAGYTPSLPWEGASLPPANTVDVRCDLRVGGASRFQGRIDVTAGAATSALQLGWSTGAGAGFVQSYDATASAFRPLYLAGSGVTVGYAGQAVGFYGVAPVARPDISGSRSNPATLASLLAALDSLGIITNSTTP